jgi:hypothetical protein
MARIIMLICAMSAFVMAGAESFSYHFNSTPLPKAIQRIIENHPGLDINFIYNELENYNTSAIVNADNASDALRQTIGLNPVTVVKAGDTYYIEALQSGKYIYTGNAIGADNEPVISATVMLLAPKDSTVITYGITDDLGRFKIPCDKRGVIVKLSCVGYKTKYVDCSSFNVGTITMQELAVEIGQVTVEGKNSQTFTDHSIFVPGQRQKNAAQNAVDLLRQMAIPQIRINPNDETVTDNTGGSVAIFINSLEASKEEIEGLQTADVRRVEYLEFPTDPRFHGAERVINFIVQEYEYGGYTKVTANESFLIGLSSRINFFSKFSYKKMTYDVYAGASNSNNHHMGSNTEGTYRLVDSDGNDYTVNRDESTESSHIKQNQYPFTVRATYASDKIQIRNLLAFTNLGVPTNEYSGKLEYSPNSVRGYSFDRKNQNRSNSVAYSGTYFFALPNGYSIDFSPSFRYTHGNDYFDYAVSDLPTIYRHAKENAYNYRLNLFLRKSFGKKHSVMLGGNGGDNINRIHYSGDNAFYDRFHNAFAVVIAGYSFSSRKFYLYIDGGVVWEMSDMNGTPNNDSYPFTHINFSFTPNRTNRFSANFQYATLSPGISQKSPEVFKANELMFISGNPLLECCRLTTANLSYSWMPSNSFSINAYGKFWGVSDRYTTVYLPYNSGNAILRTYANDGDYLNGQIGLAANWKLLNGKLQLYVNPSQSFYKSTGIFNDNCNSFQISAQASYYLGSFYFQAYYESPQKSMQQSSPSIIKNRNFHSFTVGWANSDWNLRIMAANFFNKGWQGATTTTYSQYYNERRTAITNTVHPRITFTATYTFGYGKKVQRGNEVGEQSGAASAILK